MTAMVTSMFNHRELELFARLKELKGTTLVQTTDDELNVVWSVEGQVIDQGPATLIDWGPRSLALLRGSGITHVQFGDNTTPMPDTPEDKRPTSIDQLDFDVGGTFTLREVARMSLQCEPPYRHRDLRKDYLGE